MTSTHQEEEDLKQSACRVPGACTISLTCHMPPTDKPTHLTITTHTSIYYWITISGVIYLLRGGGQPLYFSVPLNKMEAVSSSHTGYQGV